MRRLLAATAIVCCTAGIAAAANYDISEMTCERVQSILQADGEAILSYRSTNILGLMRYDRYVRDRTFCSPSEVVMKTGVPTADQKYCRVSKCVESKIFVSN